MLEIPNWVGAWWCLHAPSESEIKHWEWKPPMTAQCAGLSEEIHAMRR